MAAIPHLPPALARMVERGKLTIDEAAELLSALGGADAEVSLPPHALSVAPGERIVTLSGPALGEDEQKIVDTILRDIQDNGRTKLLSQIEAEQLYRKTQALNARRATTRY